MAGPSGQDVLSFLWISDFLFSQLKDEKDFFFFFSLEIQLKSPMDLISLLQLDNLDMYQKGQRLVLHPKPVVNDIIYTYTITDHFQLPLPIWMLQQSHCPPGIIAVDRGNVI